MNNPVIIPSNVADEIENSRKFGATNGDIIGDVLDPKVDDQQTEVLRSVPFDTLLSALVNGYVREKTEAERHAELLGEYLNVTTYADLDDEQAMGIAVGIRNAIGILGVTVAGINDNNTKGGR